MRKWFLLSLVCLLGIVLGNQQFAPAPTAAQTISSRYTLVEDFSNGYNPPRLNASFMHNFTLSTAWDLGGSTLYEPLSQTPPFALTLYAGNEDRITFNLATTRDTVQSAQVWGWAPPAANDLDAGRGRVVFEGSGDSKTFHLIGGAGQWQPFRATANDVGDAGLPLGEIVAVRLADTGNNGVQVMFDDLEVAVVTPPRRADLTLTMAGSATNVNVGDTLFYDLTLTNNGPEDAPNVSISDLLPVGAAFLPGSSDGACRLALGQVMCNLGTLAVNGSRTVRIAVRVGNDACATFLNRATVTARALDGNMGDNTAVHTATTPLPACADYAVTLTGNQVPVNPNELFTYEIDIRNHGPDTAGADLQVTWPAEMVVFNLSPDSGIHCRSTYPLTCTVDPLVPGQGKRIVVTGKASQTATGLMSAEGVITADRPDPVPNNDRSRYRFVIGTPYEYTLIATAGEGLLTGFDDVKGAVINENGEVAFWATQNQLDDFALFSGDEISVTRRLGMSDLPPALTDQYLTYSICLSMNDGGWITAVTSTIEYDQNNVQNKVGNIVHLLPPAGSPIVLDAQSEAADGWDFRQYGPAVINNSNQVLTTHNNSSSSIPSGVTQFHLGQQTEIYTTTNRLFEIGLNNRGDFAVQETSGWLLSSYDLFLFRQPYPSAPRNLLQHPTNPNVDYLIDLNEWGQMAYSQKHQDPATGLVYESFYTGGSQPAMRRLALDTQVGQGAYLINNAGINDDGRWIVRGQGWGPNRKQYGLFIGPHYVAHRVVSFQGVVGAEPGTPMFGSRAHGDSWSCTAAINNAGQVAFTMLLADGRRVVVRAEPTRDNDGDGVLDYDELGARNDGDGNMDGVPDSLQPHVAAVPSSVDPWQNVAFTTHQNFTLTNVQTVPIPANPPGDLNTLGMFSLQISDLPPGGAAAVEVTLPYAAVRRWWKYGPTPGNPTPHWYDFTFDGSTGAQIDGNIVTLHFVDGQRGDSDLAANGIIVDPGGPEFFPETGFLPLVIGE